MGSRLIHTAQMDLQDEKEFWVPGPFHVHSVQMGLQGDKERTLHLKQIQPEAASESLQGSSSSSPPPPLCRSSTMVTDTPQQARELAFGGPERHKVCLCASVCCAVARVCVSPAPLPQGGQKAAVKMSQ